MRHFLLIPILCAAALAGGREGDEAAGEIAKALGSKDVDAKMEAAKTAAGNQSSKLTTPLVKLLKDKDAGVRLAAIEALRVREAETEKKKAARALGARIKPLESKEEDRDEVLKIVAALHDLAQPVALKPLLDMRSDTERDMARARARAAANIPSKAVIDELIKIGSSGRRGSKWRKGVATDALRYATMEQVKGGIEEWRRWWSDNKSKFNPDLAASLRAEKRSKDAEKKNRKKKKK